MKETVNIEVRIDPDCHDPVILIRTDQKTQEVENIVHAIENCVESRYPLIAAYRDNTMELLSQRDIIRVYEPVVPGAAAESGTVHPHQPV